MATFAQMLFGTTSILLIPTVFMASSPYDELLPSRPRKSCDTPLVRGARLSSSSSFGTGRGAESARFSDQLGWSPTYIDTHQWLQMGFSRTFMVTGVATLGCVVDKSFVSAYRILFSDDAEGQFVALPNEFNADKIFQGNNDSTTIHRNDFEHPVVAKYIRINPRQWSQVISLRIELYGCEYEDDLASFDGASYVRIDLTLNPVISSEDRVQFRFKTVHSDGLLIFSEGFQGDLFILQLLKSRLYLTIGLGMGKSTTLTCGSALDDGIWHSVRVVRDERKLQFFVDRISESTMLENGFYKLNLEKEFFVGGMDNLQKTGVAARHNFRGCLENLFFNNSNILWQLKNLSPPGFERVRNVNYFCPSFLLMPITFPTNEATVRIQSPTQDSINVTFHFRTYDQKGGLLSRDFVDIGYAKVFIDRERIRLRVKAKGIPEDTIDAFPGVQVNDGVWHSYSLLMRENKIIQVLDEITSTTKRMIVVKTKPEYVIGASATESDQRGFRGCMRNLILDGVRIDLVGLATQQPLQIILNECKMRDRCTPAPCGHGGGCRQTWEGFSCDCAATGYGGALCRTSLFPMTCEEYRQFNPQSTEALIQLDPDGSGPTDPFHVTCKFYSDGRTETYVTHDTMGEVTVDGFQTPGSYVQSIYYNASFSQLLTLINQSHSCRQYIKYSCRNSKLLNTPTGPSFGFWVSRSNLIMDSWAGVSPGLRMCSCGLTESCYQRQKGCNCDADDDALRTQFLVDEGWLGLKDYLPVRQLSFGDTGSLTDNKEGRYVLGPLICEGNSFIENAITFWLQDATLIYPNFEFGQDGDLYFQFKTTVESGTFLHSKGEADELKVTLLSPTEMQFSFEAGDGPKIVHLQSPRPLNDNMWHSVIIERNRQEARIRVDGSFSAELKTADEKFRPLQLSGLLIIGAAADLSNGYVGCLRSLMVNGRLHDMRSLGDRGAYGVLPGCVGKCNSSPCFNSGVCEERYDFFKCNCRFTAFRGPLCADEIGAHFRGEDIVEYAFGNDVISTVTEKLRVGFMTTEPRGILLQLVGARDEYITIEISNAGTVRVAFDLGFERQEIYEESAYYANGQFHDVRVWRENEGRTVKVQVDDHAPVVRTYNIGSTQDAQLNSIKTIYLGRNYSMQEREGFIGCLSRVSFEDRFILKLLFQQQPPANVKSNRRLREDWCDVQPATHPPEIIPVRPDMAFPLGDVPLVTNLSYGHSYEVSQTVLGVVLAVLIVALIGCGVLLARCMAQRKGAYRTHEADGVTDGVDVDATIALSPTAASADRKEYYL